MSSNTSGKDFSKEDMPEATATVSASSFRFEAENYIEFRFSSCSVPTGQEQSAASTSHTPYRYIQLLKEIIEYAPHKKVTLSQIYKVIFEKFPDYTTAPPCGYTNTVVYQHGIYNKVS